MLVLRASLQCKLKTGFRENTLFSLIDLVSIQNAFLICGVNVKTTFTAKQACCVMWGGGNKPRNKLDSEKKDFMDDTSTSFKIDFKM